jgi:Leucine-rich repeat (LRR) protein
MNPFINTRLFGVFAAFLLTLTSAGTSFAQRSASKSTKLDLITVPTVPEGIVDKVAFFVHADPDFFTLEDLRRYGGNINIIKDGERMEAMKYFSLGREVTLVDDGATCVVDVALGPESMSAPNIKSEPRKQNSEVLTYWAEIVHTMPVRVTLSDSNGNVIDGFEVNTANVVRYGNESISTIESSKGSFSYSKGFLRFDNPDAVRNKLKSFEGQRFVRRKAVLMQLSKVIDELESRLFFLETKDDIEIYVGKGKHDYTELELAQEQALAAFKGGQLDALDAPIATWNDWVNMVDFTDKKAKVTKKVATGLHLNLAVSHLYRNEFGLAAEALSAARGLAIGDQATLAKCDFLLERLSKRRRAEVANPNFVVPSKDEVEREKAPDVKSAIGKRSQNKDVDMIMPGDRYAEMGNILARWNEEAIAGSAEASAAETADVSLAQRLGARLTSTIGGVSLTLSPFIDSDLVGQPLPQEVFDIPKLVYLDLTGMKMGALPEDFDRLTLLQTLVVSNNDLTELPASLANIPTLKRVVARNNQLTSLPEGMENLTELKTVDVKGNPFDDAVKVQTIRRFGDDVKIKMD